MKIDDLNTLKELLNSMSDKNNNSSITSLVDKLDKESSNMNTLRDGKENIFSNCKSSIACLLELLFYAKAGNLISNDEFFTCISIYVSEIEKSRPRGGNFTDL